MRILKIVPQAFYSTRGTPLSAYHRARELVARGHQVDILTYAIGAPPPGLDARVYRSRGPHFSNQLAAGPSRLKIWFDLLLFLNLLYRLTRQRYDLLYAHEEGAFLARIASFMSLVVPVLPATGRPSALARWPVPLVTTLSMRLVMTYEVSGEITWTGVRGELTSGPFPAASSAFFPAEVAWAKVGITGGVISSRTLPSPSTTLVMK